MEREHKDQYGRVLGSLLDTDDHFIIDGHNDSGVNDFGDVDDAGSKEMIYGIMHNMTNSSGLENTFNDTDIPIVPISERPEAIIVPIVFAIIFVIGVLGNGTLIGIFIRHRTMRNVPNMYIVSLAVGDLCVILFCVPFTSTIYTLEGWPYGEFVCKFSEFIKDLSIGVSVFTLTALSADRYFAIVDPMRKLHGRRATRITCITIAGIWILSITFALPSAIFPYVLVLDHDPTRVLLICYPFPRELGDTYPKMMVLLRFLVYYAVPLVFIATFYIIMARHLVLSTRNMPGEAQGQAKQIQARKKVAKMILSFVVIFAICFFPTHMFFLWFYFNPNAEDDFNDFWNYLRITGFCLSFFNSCINPITLYCVSGTFRKQFNEHLFCCICDPDGRSRPTKRRGFGCGCVSLSSAGPNLFGEHRSRNGYTPGRGLYRASTTNSNLCNSTMKRKSTWDTQTTLSHPTYNMRDIGGNVNGVVNGTPFYNQQHQQQSARQSLEMKNGVTLLNNTYPLNHHPYQKDYQEYMSRINALEKGETPPSTMNRKSSVKKKESSGAVKGIENTTNTVEEYTVTSFINLAGIAAAEPQEPPLLPPSPNKRRESSVNGDYVIGDEEDEDDDDSGLGTKDEGVILNEPLNEHQQQHGSSSLRRTGGGAINRRPRNDNYD